MLWQQGELSAARAAYEEGVALYRELGDQRGTAVALENLVQVVQAQGDVPGARSLAEESVAIWRELEDRRGLLSTLETLGAICLDGGDVVTARSHFDRRPRDPLSASAPAAPPRTVRSSGS